MRRRARAIASRARPKSAAQKKVRVEKEAEGCRQKSEPARKIFQRCRPDAAGAGKITTATRRVRPGRCQRRQGGQRARQNKTRAENRKWQSRLRLRQKSRRR